MKRHNVEEVVKNLYNADYELVTRAIASLEVYVLIDHVIAKDSLLNFYSSLGPAMCLDDVHMRMRILSILSHKEAEASTIDAYINELKRTPSNNTTRQLYTFILNRLSRCPEEMVSEPLHELLRDRSFSSKIEKRIMDIIFRTTDYPFY